MIFLGQKTFTSNYFMIKYRFNINFGSPCKYMTCKRSRFIKHNFNMNTAGPSFSAHDAILPYHKSVILRKKKKTYTDLYQLTGVVSFADAFCTLRVKLRFEWTRRQSLGNLRDPAV